MLRLKAAPDEKCSGSTKYYPRIYSLANVPGIAHPLQINHETYQLFNR